MQIIRNVCRFINYEYNYICMWISFINETLKNILISTQFHTHKFSCTDRFLKGTFQLCRDSLFWSTKLKIHANNSINIITCIPYSVFSIFFDTNRKSSL